MPECICPNCQTLFKASSSVFGEKYRCANCGFEFNLDVVNLARFQLPKIIHIRLLNSEGTAFTKFSVPIMIEYGYHLPPLRSDSFGKVTVTQEMFLKAQQDEISSGIMDHKGDYSLNRFARIKVLGRSEASKLAECAETLAGLYQVLKNNYMVICNLSFQHTFPMKMLFLVKQR